MPSRIAVNMLFAARPIHQARTTGLVVLLKAKRSVQIDDIAEVAYLDRDPRVCATEELAGGRTSAVVPMLKEGELIGVDRYLPPGGRARSPTSRSSW